MCTVQRRGHAAPSSCPCSIYAKYTTRWTGRLSTCDSPRISLGGRRNDAKEAATQAGRRRCTGACVTSFSLACLTASGGCCQRQTGARDRQLPETKQAARRSRLPSDAGKTRGGSGERDGWPVMRCGTTQRNMAQHNTMWHNTIRYGTRQLNNMDQHNDAMHAMRLLSPHPPLRHRRGSLGRRIGASRVVAGRVLWQTRLLRRAAHHTRRGDSGGAAGDQSHAGARLGCLISPAACAARGLCRSSSSRPHVGSDAASGSDPSAPKSRQRSRARSSDRPARSHGRPRRPRGQWTQATRLVVSLSLWHAHVDDGFVVPDLSWPSRGDRIETTI